MLKTGVMAKGYGLPQISGIVIQMGKLSILLSSYIKGAIKSTLYTDCWSKKKVDKRLPLLQTNLQGIDWLQLCERGNNKRKQEKPQEEHRKTDLKYVKDGKKLYDSFPAFSKIDTVLFCPLKQYSVFPPKQAMQARPWGFKCFPDS